MLVACDSGNGAVGPLGPQPQSKSSGHPAFEIWRTPQPVPFGTAGIPDVPPRPSFAARLAHPTLGFGPTPPPVPGPRWDTPAIADGAMPAYRPAVPSDTRENVRYSLSASSTSCALVDRDVSVSDVEAYYVEARRALIAAGFVTAYEIGRQHDGEFAVVLRAYTAGIKAEISTGTYPAYAVPNARPYTVRVEFVQRCA